MTHGSDDMAAIDESIWVEPVPDESFGPDGLGPKGRAVFDAATLGRSFAPAERALLLEAARLFDLAAAARKQVAAEGMTTADKYRGARPHPCAKLAGGFIEQGRRLLMSLRVAG